MFFKDLIGKKVLSQDGKLLGYSRCAVFSANHRRIVALLCADAEEEDFILPLSPRRNIGDALVMPRRSSGKVSGMPYSPLLKQAYTVQGQFLGCVSDVRLENLTVAAIVLEDKELPADKMKAYGDCILFDLSPKSERTSRGRKNAGEKEPIRPAVLLGRTLRYDIKSAPDKLLFAKGTRITPDVLRSAYKHKKLVELTAKSLAE